MILGVVEGLSNAEYHAIPALSASGLKSLSRSPLHFWAEFLDAEREPRKETDSMMLGTAIHSLVLEPDAFLERYTILPADAPKRPTSAQLEAKKPAEATLVQIAWWDEFNRQAQGKIVLSVEQARKVQAVADRVKSSDAASTIFEKGQAELSFFWKDPETDVYCKCRPDWLTIEEEQATGIMVDLKSTVDAGPNGFRREMSKFDYGLQAAWYLKGYREIFKREPTAFVFAAFETTRPFACGFYTPSKRMLDHSNARIATLKNTYVECLEHDEWPGYAEQILSIDLAPWIAKPGQQNAEPESY